MLNNVMNNALSGINAAQGGLSVISNNLANAGVGYYHRQTAVFGENPGTMSSIGYFGNGTYFSHVGREFNEFINTQYNTSRAKSGEMEMYVKNASGVNDLLADNGSDLSTVIGNFFTSLDESASDASDKTLTDIFLGKANNLVSQFKETERNLRDMERDVNHQLENKVKDINTYASKIAQLNEEIGRSRAVNGAEPNDLLDIRDRLVSEINTLVNVKVVVQNGNYNLSFANGLPLVTGQNASQLQATPSGRDDSRLTLGFVDANGNVREIREDMIRSGELGGVLRARTEIIDPARQRLNKLALVMAETFNEQHMKGFDSAGKDGEPFFAIGGASVVSNTHNSGKAAFDVSYDNVSEVTGKNYEMSYVSGNWTVTRLPEGTPVPVTVDAATGAMQFDGMSVKVDASSAPQDGDRFTLKSVDNVVNGMSVLVTDPAKFAGRSEKDGGPSDNGNIKALVKLQDQKLVDGSSTYSDFYASLVNEVGSKTHEAQIHSETQDKITVSLYESEQRVSGVSTNEESVEMQRMQQFFNANAKVLATVDDLFNALMRAF